VSGSEAVCAENAKGISDMGKILGSWSGMRKYLEEEMLAECLRGRIRYGCTSCPGMDGCRMIEVCIDGLTVKRFSWETVNSYFIHAGYTAEKPYGKQEYWAKFWSMLAKYPAGQRTEYTDEEFCRALRVYRNQDIQESLFSSDPLVRMFAVLDRRIGKRTLLKVKKDAENQPEWLQAFYALRLQAENEGVQSE